MLVWKDIVGYEGLYQVSNTGLVKSLARMRTSKNGCLCPVSEKIKTAKIDRYGYAVVGLSKEGKLKWPTVHRLVATAFIPNPDKLPQVNHKNKNRLDNRVENLEWCDNKYNVRYSQAKAVLQYDLSGNLVKEWDAIADAETSLDIYHSDISKICRGVKYHKTRKGFTFQYKGE